MINTDLSKGVLPNKLGPTRDKFTAPSSSHREILRVVTKKYQIKGIQRINDGFNLSFDPTMTPQSR
ncbi:MAG: hypothetical protein ACE5H1_00160 [Thermodesulfobacteriota bacterium]